MPALQSEEVATDNGRVVRTREGPVLRPYAEAQDGVFLGFGNGRAICPAFAG